MTAPVGSWLDTQTILTSSQRERSSYYNDFMCHHRMRHLGAVILSRESPDHWTSFGLQRAQIDARLGERMTGEAVSRYLRELNAQVNARTRAAEQWLLAAESMFEGMEEAVLLVSPKGSVIQAGHTTRAKLRDAHVLRSNELWHPMESMRTSLSACLRHANEGQHGTALRIPTSDGGTLQLSFVKAAASLRLLNEDLVFVRVRFPSSLPIADAEVLRCSFSITPAEARVLCALMRGEVAKQYALREGVSIHTVRKQIATLLEKMNCTRQLELVQKAMTVLGR
jgi:DNA-binding CsgD family transcriptional regulator